VCYAPNMARAAPSLKACSYADGISQSAEIQPYCFKNVSTSAKIDIGCKKKSIEKQEFAW